jgi:ABC-2 type transport system permease protein
MFYLRLWRRFVLMSLMRTAEYRASLALSLGEGLLQVLVAAATLAIVYQYTETIAGWSHADVLLLLGIYRIVEGVLFCQINPNLWEVPGMIRRGEMDMILLRPISSRFMVSLRTVQVSEAVNALIGLGLTVYAGQLARISWRASNIAAAFIFGACGLILLYAVWLACVTLAFWLIDTGPLSLVIETLRSTARYPVTFFPGPVRVFLTVIFPVAFATTFPAAALRGQIDWRLLLAGSGMAAGGLLITGRFWSYAVRHYSSASS